MGLTLNVENCEHYPVKYRFASKISASLEFHRTTKQEGIKSKFLGTGQGE